MRLQGALTEIAHVSGETEKTPGSEAVSLNLGH
jgi:hypothetical protein